MSDIKKLERPRAGRTLAGVCAAIANYAGLDVTVVRVVYVLLTFFRVLWPYRIFHPHAAHPRGEEPL
jgi:phage shock protein PspC (stress-responsive transcriptional regulator)